MTYNEFEREYDDLLESLSEGDIDEDGFEREYEDLMERYAGMKDD